MVINFKAALPAVHGAIDVHGQDGVRIKLDVAEDSLPQALKLVMLKGQVLDVTVKGEGEPINIPIIPHKDGERWTPSQRLRQKIWSEFLTIRGEDGENFVEYYRQRMEKIIAMVSNGEL